MGAFASKSAVVVIVVVASRRVLLLARVDLRWLGIFVQTQREELKLCREMTRP